MTLYCWYYRQSALHSTCCSNLQFAHTQLYTLDILIKFQMWKQPRKGAMYLLHVLETGRPQLLLPSVEPPDKYGLLPPVDPSIYGGVRRAKV